MASQISKQDRISNTLIQLMKDIDKWDNEMRNEIPSSFEKYGDHLLFSEPAFAHTNWNFAGENLWKLVCKLYNGKAVAVKGRIHNDPYRSPQVRLLYGKSSTVNYIDNSVKYTWDIEKNMFSAGNVNERHRIAKLKCEGEVIVDLFAGIGYFTVPYLVHAKAKFVHACEWNKNAIDALKRNLKINGVADRCQIYEGDNRKVSPRKIANRVNLGLIPSSEDYWQIACESLLDTGGILYIHQNVTSKFNQTSSCSICENVLCTFNLDFKQKCQNTFECCMEYEKYIWKQLQQFSVKSKKIEWFVFAIHVTHSIATILNNLYANIIWNVSVREIFKVKSYAPHIDHIVYTVRCYPSEQF